MKKKQFITLTMPWVVCWRGKSVDEFRVRRVDILSSKVIAGNEQETALSHRPLNIVHQYGSTVILEWYIEL